MFAAFSELQRMGLTLYTDALITRGLVRTRQHRVTDVLNLAEDPFLILEDVTVDEFGGRGEPIHAAFAQINLDAVLFAVATTPVEPVPELRTQKTRHEAIISVPPFKVTGTMHLLPTEGNLRAALQELHGRFLPITDATYWSDQKVASVIGRKRPWSSWSAARMLPSVGSRWIVPATRKGGIETIACSFVLGVRSSGTGSTGVVATANSTASRLICA